MLMFRSIRWRIAVPFVILISLIMLGLGGYLSNLVRQTRIETLQSMLESESQLIVEAIGSSPFEQEDVEILDSMAKRFSDSLGVRVTFIGIDGSVLGESHENRTQMDNHLTRIEVQDALNIGQGSSIRFSRTIGTDMLYVATPVKQGEEPLGFVRLALPLEGIEADITQLQATILAATLIALTVAVPLAFLIAERTTLPLRSLTQASHRIAAGELDEHLIPPTNDEVGKLTQAFNTMSSKLREQINALRTERSKLAVVLQQMTNGVVIVEPDGTILLANTAAEQIFNLREFEIKGKSLVEALRNHQLVELWQQCQQTNESRITSLEFGPQRLYIQAIATPLGQAMEGHTLLLIQDLTYLRRLETVRKDFISNISHELRTPLASLKALTETLMEGALEDPPAARRFLSSIETEVDSLTLMVQELLELSRIESGRVPLQLKSVHPCSLIDSAIERLNLQAERANLEVQRDCANDLPLISVDPPRMEQVLVNLLHNSVKFTHPGGQILLSARQDGNQIEFSVNDNGVGIPADVLPRIFERFFKVDPARSTQGTGLGLAISRHLVEAHGGRIWAESVEGVESTFYFTIPVKLEMQSIS